MTAHSQEHAPPRRLSGSDGWIASSFEEVRQTDAMESQVDRAPAHGHPLSAPGETIPQSGVQHEGFTPDGAEPKGVYSSKEIKTLKETGTRAEKAPPVIKKTHKGKGVRPNPLHGFFEATIGGRPGVVEYEPDTELRDTEQVPLLEEGGIHAFLQRQVLPYSPDAWYDPAGVKISYEISFNRHFYRPKALRSIEVIRAEILALEKETEELLGEIIGGGVS